MSIPSKRKLLALAAVAACVLLAPLLAFTSLDQGRSPRSSHTRSSPSECPVCGGPVVKTGTITDDTNAPSKNVCVWNRSSCGNVLYGPNSLICTRCWYARSDFSELVDRWAFASESPASFQRPLSPAILGVPVPPDAVRSGVVFRQTYEKKEFAESMSFWCVDSESVLAGVRAYCATNGLTFTAMRNRLPGEAYVDISTRSAP